MKTLASNNLVSIFNALGDKTRFSLVKLLQENDQICVSELAKKIGISNAGVSQQLRVLENAGLICRNRVGQKICYTVCDDSQVNKQLMEII